MTTGARTSTATNEGVSLHVQTFGSGTKRLLIVHGGPDWDHSYLLPVVPLLAERLTVALFDLRGCGRSSKPTDPLAYRPDVVASDINAVGDALGWDSFVLLGFSFGGAVVARYLEQGRGRASAVVMASTALTPVGRTRELPDYLDDPRIGWGEKTRRLAFDDLDLDVHDDSKKEEWNGILRRIEFSGAWMRLWREQALESMLPTDAGRALQRSGAPVLVLHGEHDARFPLARVVDEARQVERASVRVIADAGHMAHFERPTQWADDVLTFSTSVP